MRKLFVSSISVSFILFLTFLSAGNVEARHRAEVLGDATPSADINFPPVTSGPGLILPDSPLFFLDQFKQTIRLFLAITPEAKARVHTQIAGERLAELRAMIKKNHRQGIDTAIIELSHEVFSSAKSLSEATATGKNVASLTKEINETLKLQRDILNQVGDQASDDLKARLKIARTSIISAKIEVEDELPGDELDNEIRDDIKLSVENEVGEAETSTTKAERLLEKLNNEASRSAEKALKRREEAVRKAIAEQNKEVEKAEKQLREQEVKKQEALRKSQQQLTETVHKANQEVRKAVVEVKRAQEKVDQIQNTPVGGSGEKSEGSRTTSVESSDSGKSGGDSKSGDSGSKSGKD